MAQTATKREREIDLGRVDCCSCQGRSTVPVYHPRGSHDGKEFEFSFIALLYSL